MKLGAAQEHPGDYWEPTNNIDDHYIHNYVFVNENYKPMGSSIAGSFLTSHATPPGTQCIRKLTLLSPGL